MKRKRGYDIDDPRSHHQRGGYRKRQHHHSRQSDYEEPVDREQERMSRIRQLLVRIGERSSSSLAHNLDQLSKALLVDIAHYRSFIIATLFECVAHLAIKIPIYATLVGLINHVKDDFGEEIVKKLANEIMCSLIPFNPDNNDESGDHKSIIADTSNQRGLTRPIIDFNRIRLLCRFAACLHNTNLITSDDICNLIQLLIKHGMDKNNHDFIQQHSVYIAISTIVWSANGGLFEHQYDKITDLIKIIDDYIENRPNKQNANAFKVFKNTQIDFLTDIWKAFTEKIQIYKNNQNKVQQNGDNKNENDEQQMDEKNDEKNDLDKKMNIDGDGSNGHDKKKKENESSPFYIGSVYDPYTEFSRLKKIYKHRLVIETTNIPSWNGVKISDLNPIWIEFGVPELLDGSITEDIRSKTNFLEYFVVIDYIHDVLEFFSRDTKLCGEQLINLPSSFSSKYLVVESIMIKMFLLPECQSHHHYIFYGKIIIELFRRETKIWPRVFGPAINKLFHCINLLDIEGVDRLIEWFSFHLANFNFQWPWDNWSHIIISLKPQSPKRSFVESVMSSCLHLSFYDRFIKTLPNDIISIVPHKPEGNYKYQIGAGATSTSTENENENNKLCDAAMHLLRMLNQRQSAEDIANHLDKSIEPRPRITNENDNITAVNMQDITSLAQINKISLSLLSETQDITLRQIEMLFICIIHVGKSSCSHILSFLKMYGKSPLKKLMSVCEYSELILLSQLFNYWKYSAVRCEILCDKLHAMNYISPQSIIKYVFLSENVSFLNKQIYWKCINQSIDRMVKTTAGMKRGIKKFNDDIAKLNKNLQSDFNDQEMTLNAKQNKEKQLKQLSDRLNLTQIKIEKVIILFFKETVRCLNILKNEKDDDEEKEKEKEKENNVDEDEDDDEVDDDMLMSEQFILKQEKKDLENEKKLKEQKLQNKSKFVNKYLFDIICSRMIQFARKFYLNIDENTWMMLKNDILNVDNLNDENNDDENIQKYNKQIIDTINDIFEIKQLLL